MTFTPPVVNQLGGTPVLISGLCVEPGDFIGCVFDGRTFGLLAEVIDDSTFMCVTPLMTTLGEVEFELTKFLPQPPDIRITANFITSMLTLWWWWWWCWWWWYGGGGGGGGVAAYSLFIKRDSQNIHPQTVKSPM